MVLAEIGKITPKNDSKLEPGDDAFNEAGAQETKNDVQNLVVSNWQGKKFLPHSINSMQNFASAPRRKSKVFCFQKFQVVPAVSVPLFREHDSGT